MSADYRCTGRAFPRWLFAVIVFSSGVVIGQTLAQIAAKTGWL